MSDLINRQEAIKAIEDFPNCQNGFSDTYDKAQIIGTLEELPSAEQWIPCSERLPEENTEVLITDDDGDLAIAEYYLLHDFYIEWWSSSHRIFPIAWMELPRPYKEEIK